MTVAALILWSSLVFIIIIFRECFKPVDQKWTLSNTRWRLPPGPSGAPVIGNLLQFFNARDKGHMVPYLMSLRRHGEMTTLHMGFRTWVLLNTDSVVAEIIAKRAKITNERLHMPIAGGLVSHNKRAVIRRNHEWSESRRVMHYLLSGSALKQYGKWQEKESEQLLLSYLKEPREWYRHHFRYVTAVVYRIVMGDQLKKSKAEFDDYQQVTMEFLFSLHRSAIDFFPKLEYLPKKIQWWRAPWEKMGRFHYRVFQDWWRPIKNSV